MTAEELKSAVAGEVDALKKDLGAFVKAEDMQNEIAALKKTIEDQNIKGLEEKFGALEKAAEEQGLALKRIEAQGPKQVKSFRDQLTEKLADLEALQTNKDAKSVAINTTRKSIAAGAVDSDTMAFRDSGISQIQRGMPWLRNLFNVVTLGSNSHGSVKWYEQDAVTSNAAAVAENAYPASQSDISWVEKTLESRRLKDWIKVSKDQLKDVDFINGEVRAFINKNMRLLENTKLLSGVGTGNEVKGIQTYAEAFDTTGIEVEKAGIFDLIQKVKTQIKVDSLDAFNPGTVCMNPNDIDLIRLAKNANGDYLFPGWAIGGVPSIGGLTMVENSLITEDTMLMGDFSYGTIYEWDGLTIELGYVGNDFLEGYVTLLAYERLNLRVKDNEVGAFKKVASIATDVAAITPAAV